MVDARKPDFDQSILYQDLVRDKNDLSISHTQIYIPNSNDYVIYIFKKSDKKSRMLKLFQCRHKGCEFSILSMSKYFDHMRTHTGERPFVCNYGNTGCKSSFS